MIHNGEVRTTARNRPSEGVPHPRDATHADTHASLLKHLVSKGVINPATQTLALNDASCVSPRLIGH